MPLFFCAKTNPIRELPPVRYMAVDGPVCVGWGHAPATNLGFPLHLPSSTAPKPSPTGEGGPALAGSDEGRRAAAVDYEPATLAVNHHLRGSPGSLQSGRRTCMRRARACPRRQPGFHSGTSQVPPHQGLPPLGGRCPALAGSDEGTGSMFTVSGKKTNVAAPHQSKIKDFCQLPPRGKLSLNAP